MYKAYESAAEEAIVMMQVQVQAFLDEAVRYDNAGQFQAADNIRAVAAAISRASTYLELEEWSD